MDMRRSLTIDGNTGLDGKLRGISADWEIFSLGYNVKNTYFGEYFPVLLRFLEMKSLRDRGEITDVSVSQNLWSFLESIPVNARNAFDMIYKRWDVGYDIWRTGEMADDASKQFLESLIEYKDIGISELRNFLVNHTPDTLISRISSQANNVLNKTDLSGRSALDVSISQEIGKTLPEFRRTIELIRQYFMAKTYRELKQEVNREFFNLERAFREYPVLWAGLEKLYNFWKLSPHAQLPLNPDSPFYSNILTFLAKDPNNLRNLQKISVINLYLPVLKGVLSGFSWCLNEDAPWPTDDTERNLLLDIEFELINSLPEIHKILADGSITGSSPHWEQIHPILIEFLTSQQGAELRSLADKFIFIEKAKSGRV